MRSTHLSRRSYRVLTEALEGRTLLAAAVDLSHGDTISFDRTHPAVYLDANQEKVTISLRGDGSGVVSFPTGQTTGVDATSIALSGTTEKSSLSVLVRRSSQTVGSPKTTVQSLSADDSLANVSARTLDVTQSVALIGTVNALTLGTVSGQVNLSEYSTKTAAVTFAGANDLSLTSHQPIKQLTTGAWLSTDSAAESVSAPWIGKLQCKGTFAPSLTLTGAGVPANTKVLSLATISGTTGGDWNVTGNAGTISVQHLGGGLYVSGNVAVFRTKDYVGLTSVSGSQSVSIGGKGLVKAADGNTRFTSGAHLYTSASAGTYDLMSITGYDQAGTKQYAATYGGSLGRGSTTATTTVSGSTVSTKVGQTGDDHTLTTSMTWSSGGAGDSLTGLGVSGTDFGDLSLSLLSAQASAPTSLSAKGLYRSTAEVSGSWHNAFHLDQKYGDFTVNMTGGTAKMSLQTQGLQEIAIGDLHFMALKITMKASITGGTFTGTIDSNSVQGRFSLSQSQTVWCVPGLGVVMQNGVASASASAQGKGGHGTVTSTLLLNAI